MNKYHPPTPWAANARGVAAGGVVDRPGPTALRGDGNGLAALLTVLRRRAWVVAAVALPVVVAATWYAESRPSQYDGKAVVAFAPRRGDEASAELVRLLAPRYRVYASSPSTVRRAAEDADLPAGDVREGLEVVVPEGAAHLEVTARLGAADDAADAANAVADEVVRFGRADPLLIASVVREAEPPSAPAAPARRLIELAALAAGLLLGAGAAVLVEQLRPQARSAGDIVLHSGLPVMGSLPASPAVELPPAEALADPTVGFHVRRLRTNLRAWPGAGSRGQVLAVVSAVPGEGRSTVAALLATSIALTGARTLLVDGDFSSPSLAQRLGVPAEPGLADVLQEGATLQVTRYDEVPGLAFLPTGVSDSAGDLLAHRLQAVLDEIRTRWDFTVVDTPALLASDEARTFAALADGVLLVVSPGRSPSELRETATVLSSLEASVSGVVANAGARPQRDSVVVRDDPVQT
jgi:Mrp family chromosome partitioning ATPase